MKLIILPFLILGLTSCALFKFRYGDLTEVPAQFEEGDTLATKLAEIVDVNSHIHLETLMIQKTLELNPHVEDWRYIEPGTKIRLFLNPDFINPDKWAEYRKKYGLDKKEIPKPRKKYFYHHGTSIMAGAVTTKQKENNETLTLNFQKLTQSYGNKFNKRFFYFTSFSQVKYTNLNHTAADSKTDHHKILPEFSFNLGQSINETASYSFGYNMLNYFIVSDRSDTEIRLAPRRLHRIHTRTSFYIHQYLNLQTHLGYLIGAASGPDLSLGLKSFLTENEKLSLGLYAYMARLNFEGAEEESTSSTLVIQYRY